MSSLPSTFTTAKVDELLRQRLGVADLSDTSVLLSALARRYPSIWNKVQQINAGGAATTAAAGPASATLAPTITVGIREIEKARARLQVDMQELTRHADLYDDREELVGWYDRVLGDFDRGIGMAESADTLDSLSALFNVSRGYAHLALTARLMSAEADDGRYPLRRAARSMDVATTALLARAGEVVYAAQLTEGLSDTPANQAWLVTCMTSAVEGLRGLLVPGEDVAEDIAAYHGILGALGVGSSAAWLIRTPENLEQVMQRVYRAAATRDGSVRRRANAAADADRQALLKLANGLESHAKGISADPLTVTSAAQSDNFWKLYQGVTGFVSKLSVGAESWRVVAFALSSMALTQLPPDPMREFVVDVVRQRDWLRGRVDEYLELYNAGNIKTTRIVQAVDQVLGGLTEVALEVLAGAGRGVVLERVATVYYQYLSAFTWYEVVINDSIEVAYDGNSQPIGITNAGEVTPIWFDPDRRVNFTLSPIVVTPADPVELSGTPNATSSLVAWLIRMDRLETWVAQLNEGQTLFPPTITPSPLEPAVRVDARALVPPPDGHPSTDISQPGENRRIANQLRPVAVWAYQVLEYLLDRTSNLPT